MDVLVGLAIGFVLIVLGFMLQEDIRFLRSPRRRAPGTVVGYRKSTEDGSDSFSPTVSFTTPDGRAFEITDKVGTSTPKPALGMPMQVVYPVAAPERARVRRPVLRGFIYLVLSGLLAILVLRALGLIH